MLRKDRNWLGRIEVLTVALPNFIGQALHPIYLPTGEILFACQLPDERQADAKLYHLAVIHDDGTGFQEVWTGRIDLQSSSNGLRLMPFADGKRVCLGDYILECFPSVTQCENAALVPVAYPAKLQNQPGIFRHWSEFIVAPDNRHIAWTMLTAAGGAVNFLGALLRGEAGYTIGNVRVISGNGRVSGETRDRVLKYTAEIGYTSNAAAKNLETTKTYNIAFSMLLNRDSTRSSCFLECLFGACKETLQTRYDIIVDRALHRCDAPAGHWREGKAKDLPAGGQAGLPVSAQEQESQIQSVAQGDPQAIAVPSA